jgi:hypothetical protein
LATKVNAYLSGTVCALLFIPTFLISLVLWLATAALLVSTIVGVIRNPSTFPQTIGMLIGICSISCLPTLFAYALGMGIAGASKAACVPYVPPVTAATLPADEILVRGAEAPPVAQSNVLLRAAHGLETPNEELLRVVEE